MVMLSEEAQKLLIAAHSDLQELLGDIVAIRNRLGPGSADRELARVLDDQTIKRIHQARLGLVKAIGLVTVRSL